MSKKGFFIVFEGLDGSGKTTQASMLLNYLKELNCKVTLTREPGGTEIGESVRDILKKFKAKSELTELLLFYASRTENIIQNIKPFLEDGYVVISDRFFLSTFAYQAYGKGIDYKIVKQLNELAIGDLKPDLTILIDVDPKIIEERIKERATIDHIEKENLEFHSRVRSGYLKEAKNSSKSFLVIDGNRNINEIFDIIKKEIEKFIQHTKALPKK